MYKRGVEAGMGQELTVQEEMIFEHANLKDWARVTVAT